MQNKILVLGSSNMDFIVRVSRFPNPGETIAGGDLVMAYGGKGANQAVAARRLGADVNFITKLGDDQFGRDYRKYLIRSGLNASYMLRDRRLPMGVALIEVGPGGENRIVVSPGSNASLSIKDLRHIPAAWKGVRVFLTQLEIPLPAVKAGFRMARKEGAVTILNPSPVIPLPPELLSLIDFLVSNAGEAERLAGMKMRRRGDFPKAAAKLLRKGVKNIVITRGSRGLFFKNRDEEIWMDAFRVNAVDTTAAGDAFIGALACGVAGAKPIRAALRIASAAAALTTTKLGAQPALPQRSLLHKFLRVNDSLM